MNLKLFAVRCEAATPVKVTVSLASWVLTVFAPTCLVIDHRRCIIHKQSMIELQHVTRRIEVRDGVLAETCIKREKRPGRFRPSRARVGLYRIAVD